MNGAGRSLSKSLHERTNANPQVRNDRKTIELAQAIGRNKTVHYVERRVSKGDRSNLCNDRDRRIKGGWSDPQFYLNLRCGIGAQRLAHHADARERRDEMQIGVRQDDHRGVASDDGYYLPIPSDHGAVTLDKMSQELDAVNRPRRFRWSWFRVAAKRGGGQDQRCTKAAREPK